jgi:DNA processing protein
MSTQEQAALLVLLEEAQHGWSSLTDQVEERGSALSLLEGVDDGQARLFDTGTPTDDRLQDARDRIDGWEREGIHFATLLDDEYPAQLLMIHQRPPFVTWRGTLDARDARGVAVVGTRVASPAGLAQARALASGLAERGIPVVSGGAAGIDTAALTGALDVGGRTIAVIGTGQHHAYPRENAALQERIAKEGLVLSQFLPDSPPTKISFPMRNAVMSGYSAATVVIEAAWKSGARMQARLALEHGRAVFLMRSLLEHDWALDYAQRPGATVIDDVDDIVKRLQTTLASHDELVWS